jgi:hypothetical protein
VGSRKSESPLGSGGSGCPYEATRAFAPGAATRVGGTKSCLQSPQSREDRPREAEASPQAGRQVSPYSLARCDANQSVGKWAVTEDGLGFLSDTGSANESPSQVGFLGSPLPR